MPKPRTNRVKTARALKVLFIGNSFTARNDMPGLVATIASAAGQRLDHQLLSIGGASLRTHWNKGEGVRLIERDAFDFVVLQEQSTLPIKNATRMHENVRLFDRAIRASGAKVALYLTWARRHALQSQAAITTAYVSIAREIDATLIPAGLAWQQLRKSRAAIELYDRDGSHPTLAGSFVAACTAYLSLFRSEPPSIVKVAGLAEKEIRACREAASAAVTTGQGRIDNARAPGKAGD